MKQSLTQFSANFVWENNKKTQKFYKKTQKKHEKRIKNERF